MKESKKRLATLSFNLRSFFFWWVGVWLCYSLSTSLLSQFRLVFFVIIRVLMVLGHTM